MGAGQKLGLAGKIRFLLRRARIGLQALPKPLLPALAASVCLVSLLCMTRYRGMPLRAGQFLFICFSASYMERMIWLLPALIVAAWSVREDGQRGALRLKCGTRKTEMHAVAAQVLGATALFYAEFLCVAAVYALANALRYGHDAGSALLPYARDPGAFSILFCQILGVFLWTVENTLIGALLHSCIRKSILATGLQLCLILLDSEFYNIVTFAPIHISMYENSTCLNIFNDIKTDSGILLSMGYWVVLLPMTYLAYIHLPERRV